MIEKKERKNGMVGYCTKSILSHCEKHCDTKWTCIMNTMLACASALPPLQDFETEINDLWNDGGIGNFIGI